MPALLPRPELTYASRDFEALRARLRGLIRSVFPAWTDFSTAGFDNILVEAFCYVGDVTNYAVDQQARQAFWATMTTRIAAIRRGQTIGFVLPGASAATGSLRFSLSTAATVAVPIPLNTVVRTQGQISLPARTTAAATLPVGATFVDVTAEQSTLATETFQATGGPGFQVTLAQTPYLDGSAQATTSSEGAWTQATSNNLSSAGPTDRIFVVQVDQDDRAHILFGDGIRGRIPTGVVTINYRVGGGSAGNVAAGQFVVLPAVVLDAAGAVASLQVTNPAAFTGGTPRMTVAQARLLGPASFRAQNRSVTRDDFSAAALTVGGVARAQMITRNEDPAVAENSGRLGIVAVGARLASGRTAAAVAQAGLLASVTTAVTVTRPATITFSIVVEAAPTLTVDVACRVTFATGQTPATVAAVIRAALADLFAVWLADGTTNPAVGFGAELLTNTGASEVPWSTVFDAIRDVVGVQKVDEGPSGLLLNGLRAGAVLTARQFPLLGAITITDSVTGLTV